jgi:hypothetical protein
MEDQGRGWQQQFLRSAVRMPARAAPSGATGVAHARHSTEYHSQYVLEGGVRGTPRTNDSQRGRFALLRRFIWSCARGLRPSSLFGV